MEQEKSLYDILNDAAALSLEREQEIKNNAVKYANELLNDFIKNEKK